MALRDLWTFDHLPSAFDASGGPVQARSGFDLTTVQNAGSYLGTRSSLGQNWLAVGTSATGSSSGYVERTLIQRFMDLTTPRSWLGFRFCPTVVVNGYAVISITVGGVRNLVFELADFPFEASKEYYVEICLDRATNLVSVWVDNYLVKTRLVTFTGQLQTDSIRFGNYVNAPSGTPILQFKDFYFLDDTQDSSLCARLGVIKCTLSNMQSATGATWTASNGAAFTSFLNQTANDNNYDTPYAGSPADAAPLQLVYNSANANTAAKVFGLAFHASHRKAQANSNKLKLKAISKTGVTKDVFVKSDIPNSTTTTVVNASMGVIESNLEGSLLTTGKIKDMTFEYSNT